MNAASSLAPPAMEDPFTDSMDMASPYQGHMDDFEIDIDIMEDQPATADNDFDVQDASPASVAGDAANDADMMEDVPEVTVTATTTYYNNDSNMQYGATFSNQEPYESEMVDEDYDNNNNAATAPVETEALTIAPESAEVVEVIEATAGSVKGPTHDKERTEHQYEGFEKDTEGLTDPHIVDKEPTEQRSNAPKEDDESHVDAELQVESVTEPELEDTVDNTNLLEQYANPEVNTTAVEEPAETHPAVVHETEDSTSSVLPHTGEIHEQVEHERDNFTESQVSYMHPIKVIYQDTEISLFPPRDGDTSETYFLANEGLAHESIDGLLKECRTILGDHASSEDSLVLHVDSLGIELSEDNIHTSKMTLSKLLDIYLHLCRNSSIERPEPLYLTLTTRANLSAEIAALLSAANEGKGISDIQVWDEDYEQHEDDESGTGLSDQKIERADHTEHEEGHLESKGLRDEEQDKEWNDNHQHEHELGDEEQTGLHDDEVDVHQRKETGRLSAEPTEPEHDRGDEQAHVASHDEHPSASPKAISETHHDFDETNRIDTLTQAPMLQPEGQSPEELSSANTTQNEADAVGDALSGEEDQSSPSYEQGFSPEFRNESEPYEEYAADEYKNVEEDAETGPADITEVATDNIDHFETNGPEDNKEVEDEGFNNGGDRGEHGDELEENYESYVDEEHHEDPLHVASDTGEEFAAGHEKLGEVEKSSTADQLDQVSSETVSVSNEPVDKNDPLLDDSQPATKTDALEESYEDIQQFPDLPDLPDDDLISLGDDIFDNPEEANTEDDNGLTSPPIDQNNDASDQMPSADDTDNIQLKRQESNAGKRPRDAEEEDFGFDGTPSPGTKRTRSS